MVFILRDRCSVLQVKAIYASSHKEKKIQLAEVDIVEDDLKSPRKIDLLSIPVDEKLQKIIEAAKIQQEFPLVKSMNITYNEVVDKRIVVTNEGTRVSGDYDSHYHVVCSCNRRRKDG